MMVYLISSGNFSLSLRSILRLLMLIKHHTTSLQVKYTRFGCSAQPVGITEIFISHFGSGYHHQDVYVLKVIFHIAVQKL